MTMTPDRSLFNPTSLQPDDTVVQLAADHTVRATARGDIVLTNVPGSSGPLLLSQVLLVPEVGKSLFSMTQARRMGLSLTFDGDDVTIQRGHTVVAQGTRQGNL